MPVRIRPLSNGKYRVSTPGGVKAKATSLRKAQVQKRIIESADKKITSSVSKKYTEASRKIASKRIAMGKAREARRTATRIGNRTLNHARQVQRRINV